MKTLYFNAIRHAEGITLILETRPGARTRAIPLGTFKDLDQVNEACEKFKIVMWGIDTRHPGELKFTSQDIDLDHLLVSDAVRYDIHGAFKVYKRTGDGLVLKGQFKTEDDAQAAMAA
jgi:hypothetical protein